MYDVGDTIDSRFDVVGDCSTEGGMGGILFVIDKESDEEETLCLKYCKIESDEVRARFRREVRILQQYKGNSRILQVLHANTAHDPPYFVMSYFPNGDLKKYSPRPFTPSKEQEVVFLQMIDCLHELHQNNHFHRDIKPQNYLVSDNGITLSDFGLSMEVDSATGFTRSSVFWGTPGYMPPEFLKERGFKTADAQSDIYMLGKTFYALLSDRDPTYIEDTGIPAPLFSVLEKCCAVNRDHRYANLGQLKQALVAAYDVVLSRADGTIVAQQMLDDVIDRLDREGKYSRDDVKALIDQILILDDEVRDDFIKGLPARLFRILAQKPFNDVLGRFLAAYQKFVDRADYTWSFAEEIADNMKLIFDSADARTSDRAAALEAAIAAAEHMNRFAAMDTCKKMVSSVASTELGEKVAALILRRRDAFILSIEPTSCSNNAVANALRKK